LAKAAICESFSESAPTTRQRITEQRLRCEHLDLLKHQIGQVTAPLGWLVACDRKRKEHSSDNCLPLSGASLLGHLKINRAIATRYGQLAGSFLGMLLASARYWIKFVHGPKIPRPFWVQWGGARADCMQAYIQGRNVNLTFRPPNRGLVRALQNFDIDIGEGEFLSIVGPSGCGKSTFSMSCSA
jgi:ABC-type glutathione transport system ATPase component